MRLPARGPAAAARVRRRHAARRSRSSPARSPRASRSSVSSTGRTTATTRRRSWPMGVCRPSTTSGSCRTTGCSTRRGTSRRATSSWSSTCRARASGIVICEDIWYSAPVAGDLAVARLDLICCVSASPYHQGKGVARERMLATRAADCAAALGVLQPRRRTGRAGLRRALRACSTRRARSSPGATSSPRTSRSPKSRWGPRHGAACVSRWCGASATPSAPTALPIELRVAPARLAAASRQRRGAARGAARGAVAGARARHSRLRRQERLSRACSSGSRAASTRR